MKKTILLISLLLICLTAVINSQTIHKKDLDYFVGCFSTIDILNRRSIDYSKFIEWRIIKPEPGSLRRDFSGITYSKDKHWVYNWNHVVIQDGDVKFNHYYRGFNNLKFYILMGFSGLGSQNVLTAWEEVDRDSLSYYCGQVGFCSGGGSADVKHVNVFPDTSLLLIVSCSCEGYDGYHFYQGKSPCNFKEFYNKTWRSPFGDEYGKYTNTFYNFEVVIGPLYQITEVVEYINIIRPPDSDPGGQLLRSIDSTDVNILNLWEIAKENLVH